MTAYVALLRALNVGGTRTLSMTALAGICTAAGFDQVRTYIASGNVVFLSGETEDRIRSVLEARLRDHTGKDVGVLVRTSVEMADVLARNPFVEAPGNRVVALFVDGPLPADALDGATGVGNEQVRSGQHELFIFYPDGMARTRLRLPADKRGTVRNMNTIARLADMAAALV